MIIHKINDINLLNSFKTFFPSSLVHHYELKYNITNNVNQTFQTFCSDAIDKKI